MKACLICIISLILASPSSNAQEWLMNKRDKSNKYRFEYLFKFDNKEDTSTYKISYHSESRSKIRILNNNNVILPFAHILITNLQTKQEKGFISDLESIAETRLNEGIYQMEIRYAGYETITMEFEIKNNEQIDLVVFLGRSPDLYPHVIYSVNKLSDSKIREIINCVKINRSTYRENCSKKGEYDILIQF